MNRIAVGTAVIGRRRESCQRAEHVSTENTSRGVARSHVCACPRFRLKLAKKTGENGRKANGRARVEMSMRGLRQKAHEYSTRTVRVLYTAVESAPANIPRNRRAFPLPKGHARALGGQLA